MEYEVATWSCFNKNYFKTEYSIGWGYAGLNFTRRPIFPGLSLFNGPENLQTLEFTASSPFRRIVFRNFISRKKKNPPTSALSELANIEFRGEPITPEI